ncbi:MAG TPA: hypothetical protein VF503_15335 [Sphingobium sp.]|uniref:hypothetical protein n=1 Tax=Sphingobium sp. TaxID=1912891 RepID=UPI002ED42770
MRKSILASLGILASVLSVGAQAQTSPDPTAAPAPAATAFSVEETEIGTILDTPAAKAIVEKHIPGLTTSEQIDMARGMTLRAISGFAPDTVTEAKLTAIQADFKALSAKK